MPVKETFRNLRTMLEAGSKLILRVRPEDISPVGHGIGQNEIKAKARMQIQLTEDLGSEMTLCATVGDSNVQSIMFNPVPAANEQELVFEIFVDKCHLFDQSNGKNLASH